MDEQTSMKLFKSLKTNETPKVDLVQGEVIAFTKTFENYCVGIVDIKESTRLTAMLSKPDMCQYYTIFLNFMASIIRKHGGTVVKNVGDSLLYYFPKISDNTNRSLFADPLDCGMKMIEAHKVVNTKMYQEGLPVVNYRISSDYGMVMSAHSANSFTEDIFGPTVNLCAKINSMAKTNTMVIGGDLYQIVRSFKEYRFESVSEYHNGLKHDYPVYSISHVKV